MVTWRITFAWDVPSASGLKFSFPLREWFSCLGPSFEVLSFGSCYTGVKGGFLFLRELALTSWCCWVFSLETATRYWGEVFFFSLSDSWEVLPKSLVSTVFGQFLLKSFY